MLALGTHGREAGLHHGKELALEQHVGVHSLIGRGRDALDVAMLTTFGPATFKSMVVWADRDKEPAGRAQGAPMES